MTVMLIVAGRASGQTPPASSWTGSVAAAAYFVPESRDFLQPTVTADRGWLHLAARYNYEDLETASLWAGFNLGGGGKVTWALTPIAGLVAGRTDGVALGYTGSLAWWKLEREIQPGVLAGFTAGSASLTTYVFNPGKEPPVVVALSVSF